MPTYTYRDPRISDAEYFERLGKVPKKMAWFLSKGYAPHYFQGLFHTDTQPDDRLTRFRALCAGRRGGKTLSAAWEMLYYCLFPDQFHWDAHREVSDEPLWCWVLTKDYKVGFPTLQVFRSVIRKAGLIPGVDYKENKGEHYFEFLESGTLLQFRTADDPDSLVGAGLHILWLDEAAKINDSRAWDITSPALTDKLGIVIATTTPKGKNWFYEEFWGSNAAAYGDDICRVEYMSIHNTFYPASEWKREMGRMHPMMFRQEYMASFEATAGRYLMSDWLSYYTSEELYDEGNRPRKLVKYIGVDPAISTADKADRFVISLIGVEPDGSGVYLLDQWAGRIPFAEQLEKISEWHLKYQPMLIGIEGVAYQHALVQQSLRLPGLPPVTAIPAPGKKSERILAMSPLFKAGRIKIRADQTDFIKEWLDYDPELKNPHDDTLDSVEIALRTAGAVLPSTLDTPIPDRRQMSVDEQAWALQPSEGNLKDPDYWCDEHLGVDI